jgi:hypothetical protein
MTANDYEKKTELIKSILGSQYLAVLSSVERDRPYCNLVAFAETNDLKSIFFATGRNTRKYFNISANGNVSLLIDSRSTNQQDFSAALALTVIGAASEVKREDITGPVSIYLKKHPGLQAFLGRTDSVLVRVAVTDYILAGFDSVLHVAVN